MNKIVIGKYVNTHGIKGEIRIKSNFIYKDRVFRVGNEIIIDKPYIIASYRIHKDYDICINAISKRIDTSWNKSWAANSAQGFNRLYNDIDKRQSTE